MPIYDYECTCGHRFDQLVKMADPIPPCPRCSGTEVRKLVSASSFTLTGEGWYRDHYGLKKSPS
jgi:putative FmdB family regulatory protein